MARLASALAPGLARHVTLNTTEPEVSPARCYEITARTTKGTKSTKEEEGRVRYETSQFPRANSQFFVIFASFVVEILFVFA